MLELRAIGCVQVDIGQRIPGVHEAQHRLHFRRVGLQVVAVQVQVLGGGAPAHFHRAALVRAVPFAKALVPVDVKHRHEQQHLLVERALARAAFEDFAQRQETRILAVDLAGVDAALDQRDGQTCLFGGRRREHAVVVCHQRLHRAAFRRDAEVDALDLLRIRLRKGGAQRDRFIVAAGGLEAGALRDRRQIGGSGVRQRECRQQGQQ